MTAEIAIMNKSAIALAADSAVTIEQRKGKKIYNTVNKLFTLSKYQPIGLMIYGNATFMGVPWETIIKIYRNKLGKTKLNFLKEYADSLINFLKGNTLLFPEEVQNEHVKGTISSYFAFLQNKIDEKVAEIIKQKGSIKDTQIEEITNNTIKEYCEQWEKTNTLPCFSETKINAMINKYEDFIKKSKEEIFKNLPLTEDSFIQLEKAAINLFIKERFAINNSGVVIAGFGEEEIFPVLNSFIFECVVDNELKYKMDGESKIDFNNASTIVAFAQKEMVEAFMEGIDPYYLTFCKKGLFDLLVNKYPASIVDQIPGMDQNTKEEFKIRLQEVSKGILDEFEKTAEAYRKKYHIGPVTNIVSVLPKDELAAMAESLVNLTTFKRRVSMEAETVGGPIDVAVVSKGDGFIWIKRKHYFKPELNPHFFSNYYLEGKENKGARE